VDYADLITRVAGVFEVSLAVDDAGKGSVFRPELRSELKKRIPAGERLVASRSRLECASTG
jgi:hypothetical protein